ncbi:protein FAM214A-like [Gigantopelta aegis]|uniref:protein FAM214A-like n=1 Tax=Gigantopelta aegis TaxID=1735272 RepID=UPI001B888BCC|nr:protein FAM214A-like [Gigantopelta aegis]
MKPEKDCSNDADEVEEEKDPKEVLLELGMLVVEARTPDTSAKGRIEGPHCPTSVCRPIHVCYRDRFECQRAEHFVHQMELLWRNAIPSCIDVLLYPKCQHGQEQALAFDGSGVTATKECLLLERWTIQIFQKRHTNKLDGSVGASFLQQAVRSYLHFSQMSSWLLSTGGALPVLVIYRLYAPGECIGVKFNQTPDQHKFPIANLKNFGVKVEVSSLPRQDQMVVLTCPQELDCYLGATASLKICETKENASSDGFSEENHRGRSMKRTRQNTSRATRKKDGQKDGQKEVEKKIPDCSESATDVFQDVPTSWSSIGKERRYGAKCRHSRDKSSSSDELLDLHESLQKYSLNCKPHRRSPEELDAISPIATYDQSSMFYVDKGPPSDSSFKCGANSPSRQVFKEKLLPLKPHTLQDVGLQPISTSKKLHSPKVLVTTNSKPESSYTKRKCLDLNDSVDSDEWEKKYISTKIEDLTSPLSPEDIHAYLTNLRTASPRLDHFSSDTDTDSPKCKFFIGESWEAPKIRNKKSYLCEKNSPEVSPSLFNSRLSENNSTNSGSVVQKAVASVDKDLMEASRLLGSLDIATSQEPCDVTEVTEDRQSLSLDLACSLNVFHNQQTPTPLSGGGRESGTQLVVAAAASVQNGTSVSPSASRRRALERETYQFPSETISQTNRSKSVPEDMGCDESGFNKTTPSKRKLPTTPTMDDIVSFRRHMSKSSSMLFNQRTGLPSQSSPAPVKRKSMSRFDYDSSLVNTNAIKNALSCSKLVISSNDHNLENSTDDPSHGLSNSAPASTNCLLGNFEESMLNGRLEPIGAVDGFTVEIGASGSFCPKHISLPVTSYFFKLSDDNAPSPYLGHVDLESLGKKGYHIPKKGTVQVTLFNPNKTVVKMFVVMYNLTDMPSNCQTFLRQRTMYMPVDSNSTEPSYLRYLIHLRLATSKSGKIHLHTDIRLIFARDKFEFDNKVAQYELRSFTEGPQNPKFSPKR